MKKTLFESHLPVHKQQLSQWYQQRAGLEVSVIGTEKGQFMVTAFNRAKKRFVLCDSNGNFPVIMNPDYLYRLLETMGIDQYTMDVSVWDHTVMFDRHAWAVKHRQKAGNTRPQGE
jgi:hypothetical protein